MFEYEIDKIRTLLIDLLGEPKNDVYSNGWQSYCCPYCASNEGVESDGKYNLETNIEHGCVFHCWKCETKGKLSKLFKDFGNIGQLNEYKSVLSTIRNSKAYKLDFDNDNSFESFDVEKFIELPKGFIPINKDTKPENIALQYLRKRGITDDIINKYNIGYTGYYTPDFRDKMRIIIPSYDSSGELNYWVGRDYYGKSKIKYRNPDVSKTSIVFNEGLINWGEDITLVEGPFDHIVTPNSIPLLGKTLKETDAVFIALKELSYANINILLDDDATENAYRLYKFMYNKGFKERMRVIECPKGYDASLIYENFGKRGIIKLLKRAKKIDDYTLFKI